MCNDCEQLRDSLREFMRMFSQEILIVLVTEDLNPLRKRGNNELYTTRFRILAF